MRVPERESERALESGPAWERAQVQVLGWVQAPEPVPAWVQVQVQGLALEPARVQVRVQVPVPALSRPAPLCPTRRRRPPSVRRC